ncbi:MAG TPA: 2-phospho-L-lactate transferase [Acidobacteriota bacterium]|nr:2-phospho-L-lactate transferase [Acidobacteriota bacterium]
MAKIVVLAGGIGGSKLLAGFYECLKGDDLTVIGNTGDDIELHGLRVCPDLDTITYTLTGNADPQRGWGRRGESFHCLEELRRLGAPDWFQLGDRDLAFHLLRSQWLSQGMSLSRVTRRLGKALGLRCRLLPMSEDYRPTQLLTDQGQLHVQEYFVREKTLPKVEKLLLPESDSPAAGILPALREARAVIIAPSNPFLSIQPILRLDEITALLESRRSSVVAVSPVVGGRSLKGPTGKMLQELGYEVSAAAVAALYRRIAGHFVLDEADRSLAPRVQSLGLDVHCTRTVMSSQADKVFLAKEILALADRFRGREAGT